MLLTISYYILTGSLAFFFGDSTMTSRNLVMSLLTLGSYPFGIYNNFTKLILMTIVPAGLLSGIPVMVLKEFSLFWTLVVLFGSILFFILALIVFKIGLRRYESGNMITIRM